MKRISILTFSAGLSLVGFLSACSGSGGGINGGLELVASEHTGILQIHLTDAPLDLSIVSSVLVTIDSVSVFPKGEGMENDHPPPIVVKNHPETFDLLTLTEGATTLLAEAVLPVGFYQRIRIGVASARLVFLDQAEADLKIESHKVDVPIPFELRQGEMVSIILDFQADASVMVNDTADDKFILRPVVTPVFIGS